MRNSIDNSSAARLEESQGWSRRSVLATMGAGTAAGAFGWRLLPVAAAQETTQETTETTQGTTMADDSGDGTVRPAFGFPALSHDTEPPVEPDHTVELHIRPRDDRELPDFYFEPTGLFIQPGETVMFDVKSPEHTVTAYHPMWGYERRIPDGAAPIDSPFLMPGMYFLYTFEEAGVYDLMCLPHEFFGMTVRIVVGEATGPGAEPVSDQPPEIPADEHGGGPFPPSEMAARVLNDPALDPERIVEVGAVSWDEIADESKATPEPTSTPEPTTEDGTGVETEVER